MPIKMTSFGMKPIKRNKGPSSFNIFFKVCTLNSKIKILKEGIYNNGR